MITESGDVYLAKHVVAKTSQTPYGIAKSGYLTGFSQLKLSEIISAFGYIFKLIIQGCNHFVLLTQDHGTFIQILHPSTMPCTELKE